MTNDHKFSEMHDANERRLTYEIEMYRFQVENGDVLTVRDLINYYNEQHRPTKKGKKNEEK